MTIKSNLVWIILILMLIAIVVFAITATYDIQLAGGFDTLLGHCVGSSCSSM